MPTVLSRIRLDNRSLTVAAQNRGFGAARVSKRYGGNHRITVPMERPLVRILFLLTLIAGGAYSAELTDFRPSPLRTEYGVTSEVEFSTGLVELESGSLAHHLPQAMKEFSFAEPVWVIGYKTDILDSRGQTPRANYLCHTFFSDERV